ncbi:translocation and assembly module lipoprotein TamL [Hymenobacter volaticus]|uniref:BamA/TamA family outer membrane protein n=1 Tax=Hymenobacter volaticus TaxID=2932254 RepID=A0ABY4G687_9BACT|nr:BamA/TamA family outer membrane protein [Hymenobacter volaticus]UOQ66381.1 BamA/TamA family outer membrane protein [Hymenobacter volaticus]
MLTSAPRPVKNGLAYSSTSKVRSWKNKFGRWAALVVLLTAASCSGTKYIPEGSKLYTGSTVKLKSDSPISNESLLTTELEGVIAPKPNTSFLGQRPKLYFWHLGEGKTKGIGKWIADKYGEKPVLLSEVDTQRVKGLMVNRLNNNGYFKPAVNAKVEVKDQTASVDYTARVGKPYLIKEIQFPNRDTLVDRAIQATKAGSLLKVGDPYNLQTLVNERVRIDGILKNQGYYYFSPDNILFQVDSTLDNQVNIYVTVKNNIQDRAVRPYVLNRVTLNTDYSLSDTASAGRTPIPYRGYRYFPDEKVFKAKAITNATFLYPDSLYRRRRSDQTLSRLMSLGTFKYVDIRFRPARNVPDSAGYGHLNAFVRMTQVPKKSLRAELQMNTSNIFTGPSLVLQFRNRSALRGAEQLLVNASASAETGQGALSGVTSTQYGLDAQLLVPRLITPPFDIRLRNSDFQPRTFFEAGYKYVLRTKYFQEDIFNLGYGYSWKTKVTNEQRLQPIDLQYLRLSKQEQVFTDLLNERPFLANSFRQQFILGSSYQYTYNQQSLEQRRNQFYFSGGLDLSGNLAYLLQSLSGSSKTENGSYALFGQEYSQYTKVDLELRNYYRMSANPTSGNKIATRLLIGVGMPYLNSNVLPYLKQYGIGGPNSVRAFNARGIGPGTYRPSETQRKANSGFYDQVGDIRLEANVEYRQDLFPYVKGALFVDAGNIWLVNADASRATYDSNGNPDGQNGQFQFKTFLQQMAVGAGAGIRIDVQFFVIRLDAAYPLIYPYDNVDIETPTGDPITANKTGPKAIKLNIAIGYPF